MLPRMVTAGLVLTGITAAGGCIPTTSEAAFTGTRTELHCEGGRFQQCEGKSASCLLDENTYVSGDFPGQRKVLVETPPGDWAIRVLLFLDPDIQPRSPGTDTDIFWYEPGCANVYHYQLSHDVGAEDLFEKAGVDNVFDQQRTVEETGDHLIEVSSDARTRYLLRVDVVHAR